MKVIYGRSLVLIAVFILSLPRFCYPQSVPRIAILPPEVVSVGPDEPAAIAELIRQEFVNTGRFFVVDRTLTDSIFREWQMQQSGATKRDRAINVGRLFNVRYIVAGKLNLFRSGGWQLSENIIDAETGQTLRSEVAIADSFSELLRNKTPLIASKLSGRYYQEAQAQQQAEQAQEQAQQQAKVQRVSECLQSVQHKYHDRPIYTIGVLFYIVPALTTTTSEDNDKKQCQFAMSEFEDSKLIAFVLFNEDEILEDIARGGGEHVSAYLSLVVCTSVESTQTWVRLRALYPAILDTMSDSLKFLRILESSRPNADRKQRGCL